MVASTVVKLVLRVEMKEKSRVFEMVFWKAYPMVVKMVYEMVA